MEITFLFGLILLNGVFAMAEIALVTARRTRLQKMADSGDAGAAAALTLGMDPTGSQRALIADGDRGLRRFGAWAPATRATAGVSQPTTQPQGWRWAGGLI